MSCHTITADVERRQCLCCMSHNPFQYRAFEADHRTNLSCCEVLDCANLSLSSLDRSLHAAVGVAVSNWALFVHDLGRDVHLNFVFDVDVARFLVAFSSSLSDDLRTTRLCARAHSA